MIHIQWVKCIGEKSEWEALPIEFDTVTFGAVIDINNYIKINSTKWVEVNRTSYRRGIQNDLGSGDKTIQFFIISVGY